MSHPLVIKNQEIAWGTPVFYGTRVGVEDLMDYLTTGETIDTFFDDFPSVKREQVIQFLKESMRLMVEQAADT